MSRSTRPRRARGRSRVGERFEAEVGPVAHGGHCIVRLPEPESRVVFTRHAVPGERVVVEITEGTDGDRFWRGDAVEVLSASADRVEAPCPVAGPGLCGGCDFQHVAVPAQRDLKAAVVREQLVRLGRLPADDPLVAGLVVEAVPGDDHGLRWRTRMQWARTDDGRRGLRAHRSRRVVPVDDCLIAHPDARTPEPGPPITETVEGRDFAVEPDGFWQVHPGAPSALVSTVLELLDPQPGERVLDLYAGVGLFSAYLAQAVGAAGSVVAVEGDRTAAGHADHNLADLGVRMVRDRVDRALHRGLGDADLVVLDPPRVGAKRQVVRHLAALGPRAVVYVACDPAALARDLGYFAEQGYRLETLRAFDLFPMTSHVEVVALLAKGS
jgi:tRNA/tmRNA/rRNA uracil-C5-methylase (TrmA/RlmC/RlmD family)